MPSGRCVHGGGEDEDGAVGNADGAQDVAVGNADGAHRTARSETRTARRTAPVEVADDARDGAGA
jgi:hypothetical protein